MDTSKNPLRPKVAVVDDDDDIGNFHCSCLSFIHILTVVFYCQRH